LQEMQTDYTKMPSEDVMRRLLRRDYPNESEEQLQVLYEDEVLDRYKLNTEIYSEEEARRGRMLLDAKADRYRTEFAQEQQTKLLPKAPEAKPVETPVDNSQERVEAYRGQFSQDPAYKALLQSKTYSFGEGEEAFRLPVDPEALSGVLFDTQKWGEKMFRADGTSDVERQLLVGLVAEYGPRVFQELAQHYKSLGGKSALDPVENVSAPSLSTDSRSEVLPDNPAAAMAKAGRMSW
jgi:hypothetical protein